MERRLPRICAPLGVAAILISTLVAYSPAVTGSFLWDDDYYVGDHKDLGLDGLKRIWLTKSTQQYYPVVHSLFWAEQRLWGLDPTPYHIENILLHVLNALLIGFICRRLSLPGAWLVGVVFALHPVHVESVAWITERKNVLSTFLYLFSMLSYLRFQEDETKRWYALALVLFLLGMLTKTAVCTLPLALLILDWMRGKNLRVHSLVRLIPFFALGLALGLVTAWWEIEVVGAAGDDWAMGWPERFLVAGRALWFYIGKMFFPLPLIFIYPKWTLDPTQVLQWLYPLAAVGTAVALFALRERIGRRPLAAYLYFVVTVFPALGFFDVFFFRYSYVADHYQYLASIGMIALGVGAGVWAWQRCFRENALVGVILTCTVLSLLGALTWRQSHVYKDKETLWRDTLSKNPNASIAHNNLAALLLARGEIDEAIRHYQKAERHYNLGVAYSARGEMNKAIESYEKALEQDPDDYRIYNNLGNIYRRVGQTDRAIKMFEEGLALKPDDVRAHGNLGAAYESLDDLGRAVAEYEKALELRPDYAVAHYRLGYLYLNAGRTSLAVPHLNQFLQYASERFAAEKAQVREMLKTIAEDKWGRR